MHWTPCAGFVMCQILVNVPVSILFLLCTEQFKLMFDLNDSSACKSVLQKNASWTESN